MCCQGFHKESCEKVSRGKVFLLHHRDVPCAMRKKALAMQWVCKIEGFYNLAWVSWLGTGTNWGSHGLPVETWVDRIPHAIIFPHQTLFFSKECSWCFLLESQTSSLQRWQLPHLCITSGRSFKLDAFNYQRGELFWETRSSVSWLIGPAGIRLASLPETER